MLEETRALDTLALEVDSSESASFDPGKWTRVLLEEQKPAAATREEQSAVSPAARLRQALEAVAATGGSAARTIAASDAKTITEALRRLRDGQGLTGPLAALDSGALSQLLRLADALVTLVQSGRDDATGGKPLPVNLRSELEHRLGIDFSDVRVHDDSAAAAEANRHDAVAFAQGTNVFFADGMYDPSSTEGKRLIAHEVTHVAQQRRGGRAARGAMSEPGSAVEREADRVAGAFAAGAAPGAPAFAVQERAATGTISRKAEGEAPAAPAAPEGPKDWKPTLLGQTLDLSAKLAGARDMGDGTKQIDVNQTIGPVRIQSASFRANGDKVESGTLVASIDSGLFKGTTGSLTVASGGAVSGSLKVPINVPGLLVKEVSVEVGGPTITGKARLSTNDFTMPDFPIKSSDFELTVSSTGGNVDVALAGSATVAIDNGMAQGQAKIDIDLSVGSEVSFKATITGKIEIAGLASADSVIKYDGKTIQIEAGATVPVQLPGLEGTANIKYEKGKLSLDSKDLHFTIPQLAPVKFDEVQVSSSKLGAKLHLGSPIVVPLPGGASLTLEQSSIVIDGTVVSGDITGLFALNNAGGLTGRVQLAYEKGGDFTGSVEIAGGAKFAVGSVQVTIDNGSKLSIEKGMGVSGDIAGSVEIPGVPAKVAVHVVAKTGEPIDLTCDAHVQLRPIVDQLGGDLHVQYKRGGGANAFSFDATSIAVFAPPINGQVIFSTFNGKLEGKEFTANLVAQPGTQIKVGTTTVTIQSGNVKLLPGKKLEGDLKAQSTTGQTQVEATVGWKQGKFDWSAEGNFDLGPLTNNMLIGSVHAAAGSNGAGNFESNGEIKFGAPELEGVKITSLSGNKETKTFKATIQAKEAVNKFVDRKVPSIHVDMNDAAATVSYAGGKLAVDGVLQGKAKYPKTGASKLEGNFKLTADGKSGFTATLDGVQITASEYFKSQNGSADLESGKVDLGQATFEVPDICKGAVSTANVNVKDGSFQLEADVDVTMPALNGVKIKVALDNESIKATLRENAPPIPLGNFATLTVGADSTFDIAKGSGMSAHVNGAVDAKNLGKGTFTVDYANGAASGEAHVQIEPFAMFDALPIDLEFKDGKVSTLMPVELQLASQYTTMFDAKATVEVLDNNFTVKGKVTEVKNLGKVSDAFRKKGAEITYNQATRQVTMEAGFDLGGDVIPQLATGSTLTFKYANNVISIDGTLKPANFGAVTFTGDSQLKASWTSATKRFTVTGEAHADIAQLCQADFSVDAGAAGGEPGTFRLKGRIDATKLAAKIPGITFSNVAADFSVLIGQGQQPNLEFGVRADISGIPAAGVTDVSAYIAATYKNGEGLSGEFAVTRAKLGDVIADGRIQVEQNKFKAGSIHLAADFPSLKVEGTGQITAGEMGQLSTTADLKVTPGGDSAISKFIQSGDIHVEIQQWKLANAVGKLHLKPPEFLPIENTVIEIGYKPDAGISATLSTQFNAPMAKNGEKGTFVAGYTRDKGLFAHIEFPITVPGFQAAKVAGDLDGKGISVSATLIPKDANIVKQATVRIGYEPSGGGFFIEGSITLKPSEELELEVGVRYDQKAGFQVKGIEPKDKNATNEDHEIAKWTKPFPTIPLATVGVASLGLKFTLGVAAGYRMPRIKFQNPQLEGGLEALDQGGMPAFTFGGQIAMGAYIALSMSVQIAGEIQLLIASASAGIGAEIAARLNLELGADVKGRFAPGQGALLEIDPFVGASLDLIASLIATLYAEVCWFTIIDKKWTLASANFAHIELGTFHPFQPVGLQIGGPGGTRLTNGLALRDDAFDQIIEGVKEGGKHAGDEEANRDARERVTPVLQSFKNASHQFEQLPDGWEKGMTAAPVDFQSMFPVSDEQWDYYQDHADQAEQVAPDVAMRTPVEKLAKAVAVTARKDAGGAGRLILAWRRAQIANKGVDPDTGVNVVEERVVVQAMIEAKYQADLAAAMKKQKEQDEEHAAHVKKQASDYQKAETTHTQTAVQVKATHDKNVGKTQSQWTKAQEKKATAAQHAQQEGVKVQPAKAEKAPPPPQPAVPAAPKPLAKPAPIPVPPPVPMPAPPEVLPAVTLPALPSNPGGSVSAATAIPPAKKTEAPPSPGAKTPPTGGSPDPQPGATSNAKQVGGGGGSPMPQSKGDGGGARKVGSSTSAAPPPGPAVAAGPDGIISQAKTLEAKKRQLDPNAGAAPGGKPGVLGKLGAPGVLGALGLGGAPGAANANAAGAAPAAAGKAGAPAAGAPGAAPGAAAPGAAPGADGKQKASQASGLDPTVQKVVDEGKADEAAHKQKLDQHAQQYDASIKDKNKATTDETKKLEKEAEEAKKRKEQEKAGVVTPGQPQPGADGEKPKGPVGTRVALNVLGESHTQYIEPPGVPMVASTPTPVTNKLGELGNAVGGAPDAIKQHATPNIQQAKDLTKEVAALASKATGGDEAANTALTEKQQALSNPLKVTWAWAKVAADPAVTGGSIENPLLHPYYATFKGRVASLSASGHINVDATPFAEQTWTKICKAVKAASPAINDPQAYSNFAKGWLNMQSPQFKQAIREFDAIGRELAKVGSSAFARAKNFGFWSKEEGRSLAEAVSDLTLETSSVGTLMDGMPTLDGKQAGWDPEIWGALSNAYATAVVPEVVKGKKINVCVGAGVPAGNIWEAVESVALKHGLKGANIALDSVCTHYAAAAKSKSDRKTLDDTKQSNGIKGCVFVGERPGAIAAADAHFKAIPDTVPTAAAANAPVGTRVPMTVGGQGHTQFIDPSGKPMVASTPTPVTEKLTELNTKLGLLPATDPKRGEALSEISRGAGLEATVADLAKKVKEGEAQNPKPADHATNVSRLASEQGALAASVAKIWNIADPGALDATTAKQAVDSRATDCADISEPLAKEWIGKTRAELESHYIDTAKLRHDVIAKYLPTGGDDKTATQKVGNPDPIAIQKFQDIDAEKHLEGGDALKTQFYQKLKATMIAEASYSTRERTFPVIQKAAGRSFNFKGVKIPKERITPLAVRNQSVDSLYKIAKKELIDRAIEAALPPGATEIDKTRAKQKDALRMKAFRHSLIGNNNIKDTFNSSGLITDGYATWYGPGAISLDTSEPPNEQFAKMMTLGALQPEWYGNGTVVLHIVRKAEAALRECRKPTAFDGLMSTLWCARNLSETDYGITGGGLGEFLEPNVPWDDVEKMTAVIPTDDFLDEIKRVSEEANKLNSTPTEELVRGKDGVQPTGAVKDMYGQVIDRSTQEQQNPSPTSPAAPGATTPNSDAKPATPSAAPGGAYDTVNGPRKDPTISRHAAGEAPAGWEDRVVERFPSEDITGDDPGHTYHLLRDGTAVSTTTPQKLNPAQAEALKSKATVPLTQQTPEETLASKEFQTFSQRYGQLLADLGMSPDPNGAKAIWLELVSTLAKTDAAYKAAPTAPKTPRKDLTSDAFQQIMAQFDPIIARLAPVMTKFSEGKKVWAFWSGKPACDIAKANSEVCLERSALGGLFDEININGNWDTQMWASLSRAYATYAAKDAENKTYRGFVGQGSSAEQSIFNKIEQPQFVSMLDQKAQANLKITWYACALNPAGDGKPDPTCSAGGVTGCFGTGDRASMVELAESMNKKRIDLYARTQKVIGPSQVDSELAKLEQEKAQAAASAAAVPTAQQSAAAPPVAQQPVAQQPVAQQPVAQQPVAPQQPAAAPPSPSAAQQQQATQGPTAAAQPPTVAATVAQGSEANVAELAQKTKSNDLPVKAEPGSEQPQMAESAPKSTELKSPTGKPAKEGEVQKTSPPMLQLYGYGGVRKVRGQSVKDIEKEYKGLDERERSGGAKLSADDAAKKANYKVILDDIKKTKSADYLIFAGHIGVSINHGAAIYGFTPVAPEGMPKEQVIGHLHNHTMTFPGQIKNDKAHFDLATRCAAEKGWDTDVTAVSRPITSAREAEIKRELQELSGMAPGAHGLYYSFPLSDAQEGQYFVDTPGPDGKIVKGENQANCATFPGKIGIELPEQSGNLRFFMPALRQEAGEDSGQPPPRQ